MKTCSKCGKRKLLTNFYKRKTGQRAGEYYEKCSICMKVRGRRYYHQNRDRQLPLALLRRHRLYVEKRRFLCEAKNRPCPDCGKRYPYYVMDFDHRNPRDKVRSVAYMVSRNWSLEKIKKEVVKCEVVCANCHRMRTFRRLAEIA